MTVNELAVAPIALEELSAKTGVDATAMPSLLTIAEGAQLVKRISLIDGEVLYSPFFGFERPDVVAELVADYGSEQLAVAFAAVRGERVFRSTIKRSRS